MSQAFSSEFARVFSTCERGIPQMSTVISFFLSLAHLLSNI